MRTKVSTWVRAELNCAPGVLQIKDSSGGNLLREPTKEETCWQVTTSQGKHALGAFGPGADRIACGKVPHVALATCNSFDEGVCDCFAVVLRTWVTKVRIFMLKRFKMERKGTQNNQHGAKREQK